MVNEYLLLSHFNEITIFYLNDYYLKIAIRTWRVIAISRSLVGHSSCWIQLLKPYSRAAFNCRFFKSCSPLFIMLIIFMKEIFFTACLWFRHSFSLLRPTAHDSRYGIVSINIRYVISLEKKCSSYRCPCSRTPGCKRKVAQTLHRGQFRRRRWRRTSS